ncbi:MAG TPA: D-TA family PLP-dependent enzyme [Pirellulaceae bacterium]|nr:D-TA family PLP-dependent enzyme [Pirellulaceae bacterium]
MDARYQIADTSRIITPALVVFADLVQQNIEQMIRIAGSPARLRPHCKTHKMREVARMELERGVTKGKCATFAEAEMLVEAGVKDVFLAYNLVGPNIGRAIKFLQRYPDVKFACTADHAGPIAALGAAATAAGVSIDVLLDIDSGQHRTGLEAGPAAVALYRRIAATPGLRPGGIHLYDGQNHQKSREDRAAAVQKCWQPVAKLRDELVAAGLDVPRIVAGGTGSFPIYAEIDDPIIELSPGTIVFKNSGYGELFPDLQFVPAALLLTRVISRPTPERVTFDLGYKAVASDPPAGNRLILPDLPDGKAVLQNEEHLVIETSRAGDFQPGDELLAIPRHVCPTSALHKQVYVVRGGQVTEMWDVVARDRWLTV